MPTLAGDLVSRTEDATSCKDLHGFKCGPGTLHPKAEGEIDDIFALACDLKAPERKNMVVRVTREQPPGRIVGAVGIERCLMTIEHPKFASDEYKDVAYFAALGVCAEFRDAEDPFLTRQGGRIGDALMLDALRYVETQWRGQMPWVFGLVDPSNRPARNLVQRHGFELHLRLSPDWLYRRPEKLKILS